MPELPEVEVLCQQLQKHILNRVVSEVLICQEVLLTVPREVIEEKIPGKKILKLQRRGKYLCVHFENDLCLWFHLGMTGRLVWSLTEKTDRYAHLVMRFKGAEQELVFKDIRKFGKIGLSNGTKRWLPKGATSLGPEPLEVSAGEFSQIFKGRTGRIKSLLMNQTLVAGLGNIYADESLFLSKINPRKRANRLGRQDWLKLHQAVQKILVQAIQKGGSSIDDFFHVNGESGKFQNNHRVYGRMGKPCSRCGEKIKRIFLAGRSAHFCAKCQR